MIKMKLDTDTKDVMRTLIEDKIFLPHYRSLDISKFLDEDKKIDLWLLEVAVRYSIRFMSHALQRTTKFRYIEGLLEYCELRGIDYGDALMSEEFMFFSKFIDSIVEDEINQ